MASVNNNSFRWSWREFCGTSDVFPVWNDAHKDIDVCFQQLCLHIPILSLIAIVSAYYCGLHKGIITRRNRELWILRVRAGATLFLSALPIIRTYSEVSLFPGVLRPVDYLTTAVESFCWLTHFFHVVSMMNKLGHDLRGPTFLGVLWALNYIICWITFNSYYLLGQNPDDLLHLSRLPVSFSAIQVALHTLYLFTLFPSGTGRPTSQVLNEQAPLFGVYSRFRDELEVGYLGVAEAGWGPLARITFSWVTPLTTKGRAGLLSSPDDLFDLPPSVSSSALHQRLRTARTNNSLYGTSRNSLFISLHSAFWKHFYGVGLFKLAADIAGFFAPLLLHSLVSFIENKNEPVANGIVYALGLFLVSLVGAVCTPLFNYQMQVVGLKIRGALVTTIYRKTLSVNTIALSQFSQGEILNLMSTDMDRIVNSCSSFHAFWSIPFQLVVTLYLLYAQIGASFLAGVAFSVVLIPINKWLTSAIGKLSTKMMEQKDARMLIISEMMKGMKALKFYVWENVFCNKVFDARKLEMRYLAGRKYLDALCVYFWATTPVLISILTFGVYVSLGHRLTAPVVFTCMALLNMLISPLNAFPWVLNGLMEAWVSLKRVQRLLDLPEQDLDDYYRLYPYTETQTAIGIQNGCFHWRENNSTSLSSINIQIQEGKLTGIMGPVGSGKSSILAAILAEMEKTSGTILCKDHDVGVGYVAQTPWLQRGTVQSNILFGDVYEHQRYCSVLESCCLLEDLGTLPNGDMTSVGEGGSTISGGQKARIALARAAYKNHSLYLLDDVLSSVDPKVAREIFTKCICGILKNKTRVMVTHQSRFLVHADHIIIMKDGHIIHQGPPSLVLPDYDEIMANNELERFNPVAEPEPDLPMAVTSDSDMFAEEERASGSLEAGVYGLYVKSVGVLLSIIILSFIVLMQASRNSVDWWLAHWVSNSSLSFPNISLVDELWPTQDGVEDETETFPYYLKVYIGLAGANSVFTLLRAFAFAYGGLVAAKTLHNKFLKTVASARCSFFDITPLGRLLNRFSSDTYTIDDSLPFIMNILLAQLFLLLGSVFMTVYGLPWLVLVVAPLLPVYHWLQNHYRYTSRDLKRLSSLALSPLYSHFHESIGGLVTIRAFRASSRFKRDNACLLEASLKTNLNMGAVSQWLGFRLQMIGVCLISAVGFLALLEHHLGVADPGMVGLAVTYALTVTSCLGGVINALTETEREMVSVERVRQYLVDPAAAAPLPHPTMPVPYAWPQLGVVSFSAVCLKYRDHLPLSLREVTFETRPAERVGVVGRTGAGKSSLVTALFRLTDIASGCITIDGVNIQEITTWQLRSRMGIIPQEPFIFSGTVRDNLDPEGEKAETELWNALGRAHVASAVRSMSEGLDTYLKPGSLSVGQMQLLCLARAILRSPKVVCIDEATANVDEETDRLIQQTVRSCFRQSTVITIAHRVSTVLDNDRVLVMGGGKVLEFDNPNTLLQNNRSHFYHLVNDNYYHP